MITATDSQPKKKILLSSPKEWYWKGLGFRSESHIPTSEKFLKLLL